MQGTVWCCETTLNAAKTTSWEVDISDLFDLTVIGPEMQTSQAVVLTAFRVISQGYPLHSEWLEY